MRASPEGGVFATATDDGHYERLDMTTAIVCAFVANHSVAINHLPRVIVETYYAIRSLGPSPAAEAVPAVALTPAVPIKKSVAPDYIVCLEDGKKYKSLKRHIRTAYDLSPEEYRAKWGLPADYPMVAPNYAAQRSEMAKSMGLGQIRKAA